MSEFYGWVEGVDMGHEFFQFVGAMGPYHEYIINKSFP